MIMRDHKITSRIWVSCFSNAKEKPSHLSGPIITQTMNPFLKTDKSEQCLSMKHKSNNLVRWMDKGNKIRTKWESKKEE